MPRKQDFLYEASLHKKFNCNGNSFSHGGITYLINDIIHIQLMHYDYKKSFIEKRKEEAIIILGMSGDFEVFIEVDNDSNNSAEIMMTVEFFSYLSHVTFDRRVEFYESQIRKFGYFTYHSCNFYPHDKIVFNGNFTDNKVAYGKVFKLSSTSFLRDDTFIEMRKNNYGVLDKMKRKASSPFKIPLFATLMDTDVIYYLLDRHFSLKKDEITYVDNLKVV